MSNYIDESDYSEHREIHYRIMTVMKPRFNQFIRNGVWGTCDVCPRTHEGDVFPEFCSNFNRYDHRLNHDALIRQYESYKKDFTKQVKNETTG